jgi:hypothetical protein
LAQGMDVHTQAIGRVTDSGRLVINDLIDVSRNEIELVYNNTLVSILSN